MTIDRNTKVDVLERYREALTGARRALLVGGYGCGNLGDEAILSVLAGELGGELELQVVSAKPAQTGAMHGVDAVAADPRSFARAFLRADAIIIGGGGIFSRYMGKRSMLLPWVALSAVTLQKRVIFRALGVYGSTPAAVARPLTWVMERAAFVSVRDRASCDALSAFGLRRTPLLEPDPALRVARGRYLGDIPPHATAFAFRRVRDTAERQSHLEESHLAAINDVIEQGGEALLLPFSQHPDEMIEDDLSFARLLQRKSVAPSRVTVLDDVRTPGEMLDVMFRVDRLVAMRFHAAVFGYTAGVPMSIIAYDDKCSAFAEEHGLAYGTSGAMPARPLVA